MMTHFSKHLHRTSAKRPVVALLVAIVAAAALSGCGGGDSSSSASSTTSTKTTTTQADVPGTAKVTSFEVPATAACGGATSTTVTVSYATQDAAKQELYVDGRLSPGTDAASGSLAVPVHCDPLPHTFVMVAYDGNGRRTAVEKKLTTN